MKRIRGGSFRYIYITAFQFTTKALAAAFTSEYYYNNIIIGEGDEALRLSCSLYLHQERTKKMNSQLYIITGTLYGECPHLNRL